jgi:hypothetical protein
MNVQFLDEPEEATLRVKIRELSLERILSRLLKSWCPKEDSNLHSLARTSS